MKSLPKSSLITYFTKRDIPYSFKDITDLDISNWISSSKLKIQNKSVHQWKAYQKVVSKRILHKRDIPHSFKVMAV